jgi:micrococcal nuclease
MKKLLALTVLAVLFTCKVSAQTRVSAKNAAKHIGETVKISDKVFSGKRVKTTNATLLNIGGDAPNQELILIIPAAARGKFKGKPEIDYTGKDIIVTGKLITYKGKPGIIITHPKQLKIVLIDNMHKPAFKRAD